MTSDFFKKLTAGSELTIEEFAQVIDRVISSSNPILRERLVQHSETYITEDNLFYRLQPTNPERDAAWEQDRMYQVRSGEVIQLPSSLFDAFRVCLFIDFTFDRHYKSQKGRITIRLSFYNDARYALYGLMTDHNYACRRLLSAGNISLSTHEVHDRLEKLSRNTPLDRAIIEYFISVAEHEEQLAHEDREDGFGENCMMLQSDCANVKEIKSAISTLIMIYDLTLSYFNLNDGYEDLVFDLCHDYLK